LAVVIPGGALWYQTGDIPIWQCWFLCLVFRGGTVNWLPGSAVMVNSWQMLRGGRSPTVVVVLIRSRWLKYICQHNGDVSSESYKQQKYW